jgi:hypothetical protein
MRHGDTGFRNAERDTMFGNANAEQGKARR